MHKKADLLKKSLSAIEKYKLVFIYEIVAYLPCAQSTFYEKFPEQSEERKQIEAALEKNRINIKTSLRAKWYHSETPQLQIALMKLVGTEEELRRLSMTKTENKTELTGNLKIENITGMEII